MPSSLSKSTGYREWRFFEGERRLKRPEKPNTEVTRLSSEVTENSFAAVEAGRFETAAI